MTIKPLVDPLAHWVTLHTDEQESARAGHQRVFGTCSCGEWTSSTGDAQVVFDSFERHMRDIQTGAKAAADRAKGSSR